MSRLSLHPDREEDYKHGWKKVDVHNTIRTSDSSLQNVLQFFMRVNGEEEHSPLLNPAKGIMYSPENETFYIPKTQMSYNRGD